MADFPDTNSPAVTEMVIAYKITLATVGANFPGEDKEAERKKLSEAFANTLKEVRSATRQ